MGKNLNIIWSKCLDIIRKQISPSQFDAIFTSVKAISLIDDTLLIGVPSSYIYETIENEYINVLGPAIKEVFGKTTNLEYSILFDKSRPHSPITTNISSVDKRKAFPSQVYLDSNNRGVKNPFKPDREKISIDPMLNPLYTMNSFIEGECNRLARAAGMAISMRPGGTPFNPMFIYGASGLGKTHLSHAIGLEIKHNFPNKVVLYVSTNLFTTQFMEAVRRNELNDFLHFYQLVDVLILDDVHELSGKTGTQNTFFHLFNHLHQLGKQLILTSDRSPADLVGLEERLLTRFRGGLPVELSIPDFETRRKIVLDKAKRDGIDFPDEIIEYICNHVRKSVREIEGAMISLLAQSTFNKQELTLEVAERILGKVVKKELEQITFDRIRTTVCDYYNISVEQIGDKSRKREIVQARQIAMYFCKNYTSDSFASIGSKLGNKNHATVMHSCKTVEDLIKTDKGFRLQIADIMNKLNIRVPKTQ